MSTSRVLHRGPRTPMTATYAAGDYIQFEGDVYADISSGAGITCLGYGDSTRAIKSAMREQLAIVPYVHSGNWTTKPIEDLARMLVDICANGASAHSPRHWSNGKAYFLNSGAEAVEAACKLAVQCHREQGRTKTPYFIGRENSYHGNTFFTMQLGSHPRKAMYPNIFDTESFGRFSAYKPSWDKPELLDAYRTNRVEELRELLLESQGLDIPCVVVIETIGGTTLGIEPSDAKYLAMVREACSAFDAVLIYDEVLCGNYRTGELFAWQHYQKGIVDQLDPDIVVTGKGLTGGLFPLSAVVASGKITEAISTNSNSLWHSTTNMNHPIGGAAGVAALTTYAGAVPTINRMAEWMKAEVVKLLKPHPLVDLVIGEGCLYGIRLNYNVPDLHKQVKIEAFDQELVIYTEGGTVNGKGNFILLAPPYSMTLDKLEKNLRKLLVVLDSVLSSSGVPTGV